jgi:hypothetical protein
MAKIPQGAWNAIAARYQNGESISNIARSFGCTPPAIHYILKRNRQRPAEFAVQPPPPPPPLPPRPAIATESQLVKLSTPEPASPPPVKVDDRTASPSLVGVKTPDAAPIPLRFPGAEREATTAAQPWAAPVARPPAGPPVGPAPSPAALPGLDSQLHLRAEAAIATFRSSFDAAMAEGSQPVCERLRQAAADLMKVAARTTIVLDRLNGTAERSGRAHNYPRSAHSGEDFGKFG